MSNRGSISFLASSCVHGVFALLESSVGRKDAMLA